MLYDLEGLDLLSEDEQAQIDLEHKRENAELARELDKHLFGEDGLNFLKKPFAQQAVLMASRLAFIAKSDKAAAFAQVLGDELLETLEVLQARYEAMVHTRSVRDDSGTNLRTLRHTLQRHIQLYASAVLTMLDEDEPDSVDAVLDALRPMVNARVRRSRAGEELEGDQVDGVEGDDVSADGTPEPELVDEQAAE